MDGVVLLPERPVRPARRAWPTAGVERPHTACYAAPWPGGARRSHQARKTLARRMREHTSMGNRLEGKVAIVTGGGRGIGRAEALLLAQEGAAVVVNDLGGNTDGTGHDGGPADQVVAEIKAAGGRAVANYANV